MALAQKTMSSDIKAVIVTGELSGEAHAAHLVQALTNLRPFLFSGIGSARLAAAGVDIIHDYRDISLVGIAEILTKAGRIRKAYRILKEHLRTTRPSFLILVDFPGFNLLVARLGKKLSIPVIYLIPPQLWAWRKGRIRKIRAYVDLVLCVFPFEEQLYHAAGVPVAYIGHPYIHSVKPLYPSRAAFFGSLDVSPKGKVITLMPGSRHNEVCKHMPVLLDVVNKVNEKLDDVTFLLPLAETVKEELLHPYLTNGGNITLVNGHSHDCLAYSDAAIIASGSSTLEAAILGIPSVVVYKISLLSYLIARMVVRVQHVSLPNIIAGKEVFPEFIQSLDPEAIANSLLYVLNNGRIGIERELQALRERLATQGSDPYERAAEKITQLLGQINEPLSKTS
jgi:lipid-A-disaccharide synthase